MLATSLVACSDPPASTSARRISDVALLGPLVGRVGPNSATVWVRADRSVSLSVLYSSSSTLHGAAVSAPLITTASADFTAHLELAGLTAATTYYYDVLVDGASALAPPYPRFKTFPQPRDQADFTVVKLSDFCCFGCNLPPPPTAVFSAADADQPDLVLIGGDFDHRNPEGRTAEDARSLKRQMFRDLYTPTPGTDAFVRGILHRYPVAHMWDDHDFARNNADRTYPFGAISLDVLKEYFPVYETGPHGDWQRFRYAQAEFFLLDSRSQRDPARDPDGPSKSMLDGPRLGSAGQLQWLRDGLRNSTATWKFVVTPVVFNPTFPKNDAWRGYRRERAELVDFIQSRGIVNVILVSGDLHAGAIDDGRHSSFPELAVPAANLVPGSPVSCLSASGSGRWSVGFYGGISHTSCPGYGVIRVRTHPDRVVLEVKDDQGRTRLAHEVESRVR